MLFDMGVECIFDSVLVAAEVRRLSAAMNAVIRRCCWKKKEADDVNGNCS